MCTGGIRSIFFPGREKSWEGKEIFCVKRLISLSSLTGGSLYSLSYDTRSFNMMYWAWSKQLKGARPLHSEMKNFLLLLLHSVWSNIYRPFCSSKIHALWSSPSFVKSTKTLYYIWPPPLNSTLHLLSTSCSTYLKFKHFWAGEANKIEISVNLVCPAFD